MKKCRPLESRQHRNTQSNHTYKRVITQDFFAARQSLIRKDVRLAAATTPQQNQVIGGCYAAFCSKTGSLLIASDELADIVSFFGLEVNHGD